MWRPSAVRPPPGRGQLFSTGGEFDAAGGTALPAASAANPLPDAPGVAAQGFDLRPFRVQVRLSQQPGFRTFLFLGLGLTAVGVVVGFAVALVTHAFAVGQAPFAIAVGTVGFGFVGFFPLLLAVLQRPGRYLVSLRIDAASFTLARSSGGPRTLRWDDPGLTITVLQPEYLLGTGGPASEAEDLMVMPGLIEGALGPEARTALFTAARAHGLAYGEERYTRPGNRRGSAAVPVLARSAARPPAPGPRPVVAPEPIGDPPTTTGDGPRTFDLTHVPPPEFGDETVGTNSLARLSVAADGIELVDRKGRTLRRAWTAPELQIDLLRRLTSPLDRLDRRTAR